MHISLDRKSRGRKQPRQRNDVVAVEPEPVGQLEPARDAAIAFALAIMVHQTAPPLPAQGGLVAARDQARILHRDHRLVIVSVERPGLDLALRALTAVEQQMKRVQAVIAAGADVGPMPLVARRVHWVPTANSSP